MNVVLLFEILNLSHTDLDRQVGSVDFDTDIGTALYYASPEDEQNKSLILPL